MQTFVEKMSWSGMSCCRNGGFLKDVSSFLLVLARGFCAYRCSAMLFPFSFCIPLLIGLSLLNMPLVDEVKDQVKLVNSRDHVHLKGFHTIFFFLWLQEVLALQ